MVNNHDRMILETQLQKLSYEQINGNFSYGKYGDFKVILMNDNGYVNATKLCALAGKYFKHWLANKSSTQLIEEVNVEIPADRIPSTGKEQIESNKCFIMVTTGNINETETRGTYVHPLLVPHIASWCSPKFAVSVSKIVNNFLIREHLDTIAQQKLVIEQKTHEVFDLKAEMEKHTVMMQELRQGNRELLDVNKELLDANKVLQENHRIQVEMHEFTHGKLVDVKEELVQVNDKLDDTKDILLETHGELVDTKYEVVETNHRLDTIQEKLDIAVVDRVPKLQVQSRQESFVVFKIKNGEHPSGKDTKHEYYAIRGQRAYVASKSRQFHTDFRCKEILNITYQPNPRNLFIRMKKQMKKDLVFSANWFSRVKGFSESSMIDAIHSLDSDKYEVET